jgi:hypothetical protein
LASGWRCVLLIAVIIAVVTAAAHQVNEQRPLLPATTCALPRSSTGLLLGTALLSPLAFLQFTWFTLLLLLLLLLLLPSFLSLPSLLLLMCTA